MAFVVVVLGTMGNFLGAFLGGLIIGVVEAFAGFYLGGDVKIIASMMIFILILLVQAIRTFWEEAHMSKGSSDITSGNKPARSG